MMPEIRGRLTRLPEFRALYANRCRFPQAKQVQGKRVMGTGQQETGAGFCNGYAGAYLKGAYLRPFRVSFGTPNRQPFEAFARAWATSGARRCCWAWDTGLGCWPTGHLVHVRGLVCGPGAVDRAWAWSHISMSVPTGRAQAG